MIGHRTEMIRSPSSSRISLIRPMIYLCRSCASLPVIQGVRSQAADMFSWRSQLIFLNKLWCLFYGMNLIKCGRFRDEFDLKRCGSVQRSERFLNDLSSQ
jgi:hypothetical protein